MHNAEQPALRTAPQHLRAVLRLSRAQPKNQAPVVLNGLLIVEISRELDSDRKQDRIEDHVLQTVLPKIARHRAEGLSSRVVVRRPVEDPSRAVVPQQVDVRHQAEDPNRVVVPQQVDVRHQAEDPNKVVVPVRVEDLSKVAVQHQVGDPLQAAVRHQVDVENRASQPLQALMM